MPNYDYEVNRLVEAYKRGVEKLLRELERVDITEMSKAQSRAMLASVSEILANLNEESRKWVEENVPMAARQGVAQALVDLAVVGTLVEAQAIVKFNRVNNELVKAVVADTYNDLLEVTKRIDNKVRVAVRKVTATVLRDSLSAGINGRKTINREILAGLRKEISDSVNTGLIDAAGRRWKPHDYVDMVTRTKLMEAYTEAQTNEALSRDAFYGVISSHNAKDACRYHEGRIIKLTPDAPGPYPTKTELQATGQIWHPRCRHVISVVRNLDRLPTSVRDKADRQAEVGAKAIATNKRDPKDVE
jgi:Phage minor capsid protein 2